MPPPLAVDREQVRMLVLSVGVREAARQCGIAQGTVQDWSASGKWLEPTKPKPATLPPPASMVRPTNPTKPADALAERLARERDATTTAMSRIALKTALSARNVPLTVETPQDLLALANAHAKIHRIDREAGETSTVAIQINVG